MTVPGFTAEESLYKTSGQYRTGRQAINSSRPMIIPAIPMCQNCDHILDQCESHGWRPRAVCNACLFGDCSDEPPAPDPFPDPFGRLPKIS